ncbi:methionyl-tRNA formyltransferase [Candidatus Omnitrophus magneticus]|uniref:Methionyl-tRNA formyltransferase n=1 Tax=Candidatus Omnitrophus magneticus TaxID=1609969 RepID=A0A0F0CM50_9BACT|nr:methionyl-tRNA formyltransferase [Candidatus Omnitrophus magneticus]
MSKEKKLNICVMAGQNAGVISIISALSLGCRINAAVSYSKECEKILSLFDIPVFKSIKDDGFKNAILISDLLLSAHGREIVSAELLKIPKYGGVNIHPYLYAYKGADPVGRAILDSNFRASVGSHIMTEKIDEGKVLFEEFIDVAGAKTREDVYSALYPFYAGVVIKTLRAITSFSADIH